MKALLKTACGCKKHITVPDPPPNLWKVQMFSYGFNGLMSATRTFQLLKYTKTGCLYEEVLEGMKAAPTSMFYYGGIWPPVPSIFNTNGTG